MVTWCGRRVAQPAQSGGQGWVGPPGSPGRKKSYFPKVFLDHLGCSSKCFSPVVARFGPWRFPKCLENGLFWDQKWVKNGSKTQFSKADPGALPNLRNLAPKTGIFCPKEPPNPGETPKRREAVAHFTCGLTSFTVSKSALVPSMICPRNGPKRRQKARKCAQHPETKRGPYLGLRGSNPNSEGTWSTRNPPLFVVSKPQTRPTRCVDPRTSGHLVQPEGSPARAQWGPTVGGSTRVPGAKQNHFFQKCS